jgi:predicted mannosyl-3-phosphoglycerate phosphatase (HAD superfamily)
MVKKVVKSKVDTVGLAISLLKRYHKFIIEETTIVVEYEYKNLFKHALKDILELESFETTGRIYEYGDVCISYLKETTGLPKNVGKLELSDRVSILSACEHGLDLNVFDKELILKGRLKYEKGKEVD